MLRLLIGLLRNELNVYKKPRPVKLLERSLMGKARGLRFVVVVADGPF